MMAVNLSESALAISSRSSARTQKSTSQLDPAQPNPEMEPNPRTRETEAALPLMRFFMARYRERSIRRSAGPCRSPLLSPCAPAIGPPTNLSKP